MTEKTAIFLAVVILFIVIQRWVLPRFGVKT